MIGRETSRREMKLCGSLYIKRTLFDCRSSSSWALRTDQLDSGFSLGYYTHILRILYFLLVFTLRKRWKERSDRVLYR